MLQPNEFKIYNASAGAGKTYTLVKEYLSILLSSKNPFAFESILAITFTNKASNEMKERILKQLLNFSQADYAENSDLQILANELHISDAELHDRSKEILVKILHNYSRFAVSTIDKFNLRLMKSFAQDLGLSNNFNVEMEVSKLLEESVNQLFAKIGEDELLTSILIEISLDNLFDDFSWDLTKDLVKRAKVLYEDHHLEKIAKLQKLDLNEFNLLRRKVFQKVNSKKNSLKKIGQQGLDLAKNHGISLDEFSFGTSGFIGFFLKLTHEKFDFPTPRHITFAENQDPKKYYSGKATPIGKAEIPIIAPQLIEWFYLAYNELKDLTIWESIQKTIASMSILNEVEKVVDSIKKDNNILLISEFNKIISSNLQNQPSGFIYERIGNRYHHYFIDEFQDTSTLQWRNLLPLIENARAGNDTVMLVGDAKQSIYRWRGGNPEQMMQLIDLKEDLNIQVENLPKNWRSYDQIISFNNQFYSRVADLLKVDAYKELYATGSSQETNPKKGGYVQLNIIEKKDGIEVYQMDTVSKVLEIIEDLLLQGFSFNEIAILHRTKAQGKIIAQILSENKIPLISTESLLVSSSQEIQLIELFFKTLSNANDQVSKAEFLLKLYDLGLVQSNDITADIKPLLVLDYQPIKTYLKRFAIDLEFAFEPSVSLYDLTEKTIKAFDLAKFGSAYVQFFLDYVLEFSSQNEYSLVRFLENWELQKEILSISLPEDVDAVNLMTIHKSKGLEFPVVIMPFTDWGERIKSPNFWIPIQDSDMPFEEFLVDAFGNLEKTSPEIKEIIENEKNEFLLDNLNLLYVATTRAVEQLYILSLKTEKENASVAYYFNEIFSGENEQILAGEKGRVSQPKHSKIETKEIKFAIENWENRIQISKESSKRWKKREEILYGELVHELMKNIKTEEDVQHALSQSIMSGEITSDDVPKMKKKFLDILHHPELMSYYKSDVKILNERDFVNENGEIYRPDRLVIDGNKCTIIDYKTGYKKEKDEIQVRNYAENLKKLGYEISNIFIVYIHEEILVDIL